MEHGDHHCYNQSHNNEPLMKTDKWYLWGFEKEEPRIADEAGNTICLFENDEPDTREIAAHIVHCVNTHDELVYAAKLANIWGQMLMTSDPANSEWYTKEINRVRAAVDSAPLAAAKKGAEIAIPERLEQLREALRAENISYGELAELQSLAAHIAPDDVELLEAAGVPEHPTAGAPPRLEIEARGNATYRVARAGIGYADISVQDGGDVTVTNTNIDDRAELSALLDAFDQAFPTLM